MQLLDGQLIHTATDLASFLGCIYRAVLTREAARGHLKRPTREDPLLDRLAKRGIALESDWITSARNAGREVVTVPRPERGAGLAAVREAAKYTLDLMRGGTEVIVQGVLFDGMWLGYADVLERVSGTSVLGDHSYEVADTKLRGYVYAGAVVQLAQYTAQLGALIGAEPATMHVDLGDGRRVSVPMAHAASFNRRLRDRYLRVVADAVGLDGTPEAGASPPLVPVAAARGRDPPERMSAAGAAGRRREGPARDAAARGMPLDPEPRAGHPPDRPPETPAEPCRRPAGLDRDHDQPDGARHRHPGQRPAGAACRAGDGRHQRARRIRPGAARSGRPDADDLRAEPGRFRLLRCAGTCHLGQPGLRAAQRPERGRSAGPVAGRLRGAVRDRRGQP